MAELFLVRHAQASFHAADYDCLSELGERQARVLGGHFNATGRSFDGVATGTLRRHAQTVAGIDAGIGSPGLPAAECHPGLDEYDFRTLVEAFEALEPDHPLVVTRRADPADKTAYYRVMRLALLAWEAGRVPGDKGESWQEFTARVEAAATWLQGLTARCKRILVVSSGGAMATLLGGRLGLGWSTVVDLNMQIRNTSVSQFYLNRERFLLVSWNSVAHLEPPGGVAEITYG